MIARVSGRDDFRRLRRDGVRVRADPLWCSYVYDPDVSPTGVAFALGRNVGPAVTRNRVRRRLRAILREESVPNGLLLLGARPEVTEQTFDDLTLTVRTLLQRLGERTSVPGEER